MMNLALWLECWRWRRAERSLQLWWRDDDAVAPSAQLDRLLAIAERTGAPLTLAVIPVSVAGDLHALAERLGRTSLANVAQHGVDHLNRRSGPAAGEFPHDLSRLDLIISLRRGWSLLQQLPQAQSVFVPPWNDIHPELAAALGDAGYIGWSATGALVVAGRPPRVDVHLDLLRWRGGARFRGRGNFLNGLVSEMRRRRRAGLWEEPVGILTHHLVHDAAAWQFLEAFLSWTRLRPEFGWSSLPDLLRSPTSRRLREPKVADLQQSPNDEWRGKSSAQHGCEDPNKADGLHARPASGATFGP